MQTREYYRDIGYKPFLFYVVFGVTAGDLHPSRSRHHVESLPEALEIHVLRRPDHSDYMDGFFSGELGRVLRDSSEDVYERCLAAEDCIIIRGSIEEDSSLDYMISVIGIIQSLMEEGAAGVLDFPAVRLFSPAEWEERFFEKEISACNHVVILYSEEPDGFWLHTRGMGEFGRPDCSIRGVDTSQLDEYAQILDQMIFYSGLGVFFDGEFRLHTQSGNAYAVTGRFVEDFENDDFNNAYCEIGVSRDGPQPGIQAGTYDLPHTEEEKK